MTGHPLAGIYAASLTPLTPALIPDIGPLPAFLSFLADRGCHGALLFGTTGEGPSFSPEERGAVLEAALKVRETHPDFRLLAGTGTPSLTESITLTKTAFDLGYDAVLTLPPYYFRKAGDQGLFDWFSQVLRTAVPSDGVLLGYHIPGTTGIGFSLDLIKRLKDAFPLRFAGIKDSSHDPGFARALGETFGADLVVFNGTDTYLQLALENGAAGGITAPANIISPDLRAVYDAFVDGEDPAPAQARVTAVREVLENYLPFPPMLKALLPRRHPFPHWPVRPPLVDVDDAVLENALDALEKLT
jgi:4-hydroxy-tetrahydrodipicolinate synthase